MLLDARSSLSDRAVLEADVCIVGAGAAGIALARKLRESSLRVLVLEGGGLEPTRQNQALYEGDMLGLDTWTLSDQRVRVFGGSTYHWSGWCMPLNSDDFDARDHLPGSGWPIAYEDVARHYPEAASILEIGSADYWNGDALARAEHLSMPLAPTGRLEARVYQFSPPTRFGDRYRQDVAQAENVIAYHHANVTGIELRDGADRVTHLTGQVLDGPRFAAVADRYVLCLGGIENARLLLASRGQDPAGVANSSDLVGRCFMEHPHIYTAGGWLVPEPAGLEFFGHRQSAVAGVDVMGVLGLTSDIRREEGLLDCTIQVSEPDGWTPPGEASAGVASLLRSPSGDSVRRLHLRAEQSPNPESRITLGTQVDALGLPRARLDWRLGAQDLSIYGRIIEHVGIELGASGLGRAWRPADTEEAPAWYIDSGGHHMGTTRMGHSATDGVVDKDCRCFDVDNLYLCGSSVFRTGGSANPTLTIVALALRLGNHLMDRR